MTNASAQKSLTDLRPRVGQQPPHNFDAEQALLAVLLSRNDVYYEIAPICSDADYFHPVLARIFAAISKTIDAGRKADAITLRHHFERDEEFIKTGGSDYLSTLAGIYVSHSNAKDYAQTVHDLATRRRLLEFGHEVQAIALENDVPDPASELLIGKAEKKLYDIAERGAPEAAMHSGAVFDEAFARIEDAYKNGSRKVGISTGIARLDEMLGGGLQQGALYTMAGRPSMGKTAIGLTIAVNAAISGAKTVFYSLEMDRVDIMGRLIARETGIASNYQLNNLPQDGMQKIIAAKSTISSWPLYIDHTGRLNFSQLRGRAIRQKRRFGLDLMVIDYLGLMAPSDARINRNYQIEEITTGLKTLAKELRIPILLLCQLNRQLEGRDDKRPTLSDLRDSGSIEQDSDVVMFIYRHEYYLRKADPQRLPNDTDEKFNARYDNWEAALNKAKGKGEIIIGKQRNGECGTVPLLYRSWKCLFEGDDGDVSANQSQ